MTLEQSVIQRRLYVITRAHELGNVSAACHEAGISRTLFYRWRARCERYGIDGLHPRRTGARRGRPVATPPHVERLVDRLGAVVACGEPVCRRAAGGARGAHRPAQGGGKVWQLTACDAASSYGAARWW